MSTTVERLRKLADRIERGDAIAPKGMGAWGIIHPDDYTDPIPGVKRQYIGRQYTVTLVAPENMEHYEELQELVRQGIAK